MKKMNWKMFLGIGLISIFIIFAGLFLYAYKKISPSEIKKIAVEQLQKTFPKANVTIGEIKLTPSFSFKLEIDKVNLSTSYEGHAVNLFSAQELKVKIPLWAALTGVGKIEVKLDKPVMSYAEFVGGDYANNWTYAMDRKIEISAPSTISIPEKAEQSKKEPSSISIPAFLSNIKADIRVYDIVVDYSLKDSSKGQVTLSRFLVKDINLKGQTAFELDSAFTFKMKNNQSFGLNTLVVGQVNLGEFVEKQKLATTVMIQLTNITSSLLPKPLPDIRTNLNVTIDKDGKIEGDLATTFYNRNKISANYLVQKGKTKIDNLNVALFIKDLVEILDKKALLGDISDSSFNILGSVELSSDGKTAPRIYPDFKFNLMPELEIPSAVGKAKVKLEGSYRGEAIQASIATQLLDGVAEVLFKGEFDSNMKAFDMKKLKPFILNIKISHLNITKDFIQKNLYSKKPVPVEKPTETINSKSQEEKVAQENTPKSPMVLPAGTISINWEKIQLDKNYLDGKALILMSNDKVTTKSMTFTFSEGRGELTHLTQIENTGMNHKFDFKLNGLNMAGLYPFLPPIFEQIKGTFSGVVKGNLNTPTKGLMKYDVAVDLNAKKGELKGVNLSDYVNSVTDKLPDAIKSKLAGKKMNADGNFEIFLFKGNISSDVYLLEKMKFVGVDNKVDAEGSGQIYPPPSDKIGTVDLNVIDNSGLISSQLEKYAGTKVLPLRLTGPGFLLKPDYQFTIEKLLKATTKKQVDVVKTKAKDFIQQKINEQINSGQGSNVQENLKGVFKGLFKKK